MRSKNVVEANKKEKRKIVLKKTANRQESGSIRVSVGKQFVRCAIP